jgi:hypothetical protein
MQSIMQCLGATRDVVQQRQNKGRSGPVWENVVLSGGGIKAVVHPAALGTVFILLVFLPSSSPHASLPPSSPQRPDPLL